MTSTFAHAYLPQAISLWLSFLPSAAVLAFIAGAALCGNRNCTGERWR